MQSDDGGNDFFYFENVSTQALVVVHQVEIIHSFFQFAVCAHAESLWFSKSAFKKLRGLNDVGKVVELPVSRETTGVLVVENIEAG